MTPYTIIDIETLAESQEARALFKPEFSAPANYKDADKIKAAIEQREKEWESEAALSSLTGKIVYIGCWTEKKGVFVLEAEDESDVVTAAMDLLQSTIQAGNKVVGFCNLSFDLPFLCQRAWRLGVYVPKCLRNGKWWADEIIDLANIWSPGSVPKISLDHLAKALGVGAKNGEGKDFGKLWNENKPAALEYCRNDVVLIKGCAEKML